MHHCARGPTARQGASGRGPLILASVPSAYSENLRSVLATLGCQGATTRGYSGPHARTGSRPSLGAVLDSTTAAAPWADLSTWVTARFEKRMRPSSTLRTTSSTDTSTTVPMIPAEVSTRSCRFRPAIMSACRFFSFLLCMTDMRKKTTITRRMGAKLIRLPKGLAGVVGWAGTEVPVVGFDWVGVPGL